jgi:hypothetical protein
VPFALIIAGIILTVAGVRNTQGALFNLLEGDFTGNNSFIWWSLSILVVGTVGYVPSTRQLANAFLALILIVLFLANGGVFQKFTDALKAPIPPAPVPGTTTSTPSATTATTGS